MVGAGAGDTAYDITVVGPNRFLRRYVGDIASAGADARVEAIYYDAVQDGHGHNGQPKLELSLHNDGSARVTFTIRLNNYSSRGPQHVAVAARQKEACVLDTCGESDGWYDLTITVSSDSSWSQRLTGHLETGRPSISG
jgi:phospholipase C